MDLHSTTQVHLLCKHTVVVKRFHTLVKNMFVMAVLNFQWNDWSTKNMHELWFCSEFSTGLLKM